jgi:branched-chain amino acid transport system substrate-binding protein
VASILSRMTGFAAVLASLSIPTWANGVTPTQITLGSSLPLTGPIAASAKEGIDGALAYFDQVNRQGGVYGRKIKLEVLDDKQDAKIAVTNTLMLIEEKGVLGLMLYRTTPAIEASLPHTEKFGVPFLFPQVGSAALYDPKHQWVFTIRAAYQLEAQRAVEQLVKLGIKQIAVLQSTDAFGKDAFQGVEKALSAANLRASAVVPFDNKTADVTEAVQKLSAMKPQAVVMIANSSACAGLVRGLREKGVASMFISLSNTSSASYLNELGDAGRGVGITQVVPNPLGDSGLSAEFMKLRESAPNISSSHSAFQGYLSARVLVDALKKAGKDVNRAKLKSTLEGFTANYYGYKIQFTPTDRHGSDFVELAVVGKRNKLKL